MKFLFDFFPILLFFVAYKLFGIYTATATAIAASVVQVGYSWLRHRKVETMHWVSMGLIVVLGGATLIFHDIDFIKWKVTAINWLFAAVLMGSHWVGRRNVSERMLGASITVPPAVWRRVNMITAAFFFITGVLNLYVAFFYGLDLDPKVRTDIWVNFKFYGILGLNLVFFVALVFYLARHMEEVEDTTENEAG
ncbi:MAG TPA: septation protein A [Gammaproteobacteria bacterium]|nr:septation protein A [Gammaproteobacteria bacterium]